MTSQSCLDVPVELPTHYQAPPLACRKGWEEAHANFATVEILGNVPMSHGTHGTVNPI